MSELSTVTGRLGRVTRALLVTGSLIHLVLVCAQPFLAGWSLDGDGYALDLHGINGSIILTVSMILIPLSILWWRPGRGTISVPVLTVVLFVGETFQLGMGYADIHTIHIPLGVGIVVGSAILVAVSLTDSRRKKFPQAWSVRS